MFSIEVEGEHVVGFRLYGMHYQEIDEKYKRGEKLESIRYSSVLGSAITLSVLNNVIGLLQWEYHALKALEWFLSDLLCSVKYTGDMKILSTDRGSIVFLSELGELGGVILNHPNDTFVVRALMKRYYEPKAWCYHGDIMDIVLSKYKDVELVCCDKNGVNHYTGRNHYGKKKLPVEQAIRGLPLNMWEVSNV